MTCHKATSKVGIQPVMSLLRYAVKKFLSAQYHSLRVRQRHRGGTAHQHQHSKEEVPSHRPGHPYTALVLLKGMGAGAVAPELRRRSGLKFGQHAAVGLLWPRDVLLHGCRP